jgi:NADP-dependent 3-hydroxy acid dehydrogenase YdfG
MAENPLSDPVIIWGAGAIGGTIGAYWARAGVPVLLVDRAADHVEACRTQGLRIEGPIETFNRVMIVTGAAQGIGGAIAKSFLGAGARVHLADIDEAGCAKLGRSWGSHSCERSLGAREGDGPRSVSCRT